MAAAAFAAGLWPLAAFDVADGVFCTARVAILPALVMNWFGGRNVSGMIGILYTRVASGTVIGPAAAGFVYDMSHADMLPTSPLPA